MTDSDSDSSQGGTAPPRIGLPRPRAPPPLNTELKDGLASLVPALAAMGMELEPKVLRRIRERRPTYADFLNVFQTTQLSKEKAEKVCSTANLRPAEERIPCALRARRYDWLVPQTAVFPLRAVLEYQRAEDPAKVGGGRGKRLRLWREGGSGGGRGRPP